MKHAYFVTGTDTGVGKTLITAALTHCFALEGNRAVAMKPVAAGCVWQEGVWMSDDVALHAKASNLKLSFSDMNPYAFEPPIAPHLAAKQAGVEIELVKIQSAFDQLAAKADVVIVEGAGGFYVPLNETEDTADMAKLLGLPVILVVGMRLGCINHALLTAEAIKQRGLTLAGWVANQIDADMTMLEENLQSLQQRISAPFLGLVPHINTDDYAKAAEYLDIQRLA